MTGTVATQVKAIALFPNHVLLSLAAQLIDYFPDYAEALANTIKPLRLSVNVEITIETIRNSEVRGVVINNLHTSLIFRNRLYLC